MKGRTNPLPGSLLFAVLLAACAVSHAATPVPPALQFQIVEGHTLNAFYQQGPVAAHLLLNSGTQPRVLVAFPAGNSGTGVWFETTRKPMQWKLENTLPLEQADAHGRTLHGIVANATADTPLVVRDAVLGSVRILRDYQIEGKYPPEVATPAKQQGNRLTWSRPRLDGAPGYLISIEALNGRLSHGKGKSWRFRPTRAGAALQLRITALTGETPLTPLGEQGLLNANAGNDVRSRQALAFLSYEEKFLAGSWRFNTYFGRDTLMSLRLLMPALQPAAIEDGLGAVLVRLNAQGEAAHEEDIGEFAVLRHRKQGDAPSDAPLYDYGMIDDDFMLAPVAAHYLLDLPDGKARAADFLARQLPSGETVGAALTRNFVFVVEASAAFAGNPGPGQLVSLKDGRKTGQWRDSNDGLADGRYPYDVNAVFMPAALKSIAQMQRAGLLKKYASAVQAKTLLFAARRERAWSRVPGLFRTHLAAAEAKRQVQAYAASLGVPADDALASVPGSGIDFAAIALDAQGKPIPVLNSDGGFALLMQQPSAAELTTLVDGMLRPFPAGLLTDAGLLVANPAFASADIQKRFGRGAYHGTVVWSWQQALLAAGLRHQLQRKDLSLAVRARLNEAQARLWATIEKTSDMRTSELWSWTYQDGHYLPAPFGQSSGDADESNAAQLWSTVYLALPPPAAAKESRK